MLKKIIILIVILITNVNYAQLSTKHWIPPIHAKGGETYVQEHLLYLSTPEPTPFQVTVTDGSGTPIAGSPFTISQGNPQSIVIGNTQPSVMMLSLADLNIPKTDKGLIAEGTGEFYASFRLRAQNHAEILVCKGTTGAGTSFRLGSLPMTGPGSIRNFMASFMATENNTVVTLSDYDTGVVFASGTGNITNDTQTFNLNAGQSVTVSGYTDFAANLSGFVGALLTSNKPIVVNTGNATGGMLTENSGQDFNLDQIVPVAIVGDEYIVVKGNGSANTERPLVIATQDNTQIFINGNPTPVATINAGDYYLAPSSFYTGTANQNMFISSDRPIYLYQIIAGAFSDATSGLNFIPPLSCFWQKSVDMIPNFNSIGSSNYPNSEIIVVTETGSTVSINNVPTTATPQAVTGNQNWVTYRITGLSGNVRIDSTGALAAGVFGAVNVAGFGGYYSGFGSLPQDTAVTLCSNQTVNLFNAITGNPEANGTWTIPVGAPPLSGNNFNGAVNTAGDYIYSFTKNCDNSNLVINITVSVTVQQAPFAGANNTLSICRNANPVDLFTLLGTGITTGGNWQPALASGTGVYNPAVDVSGTYTYTIPASTTCASVSSNIVVTNNPLPTVSNQTITTCSDVALNYDLDALISGSGDTYRYTVASSDATNVPAGNPRTVANATNITDVYTNMTGVPVTIAYTIVPISASGCIGSAFVVVVTVNPEPAIANQTVTTCSDVALNFDLDALIAGTGDTFTYTVASSDATNVPAASPRTTAAAANITDVYTNTTTAPVTITYTVTPIGSNGCTGNTFTVAVTVNPEPVVTNQTVTTCSDIALNFDLDALIAGTGDTFTYTVASSDATNVPAASPRTLASATNITDVYTNTTTAPVTITYTVTPISTNGCIGSAFIITITVNPEPVVTNQTVATCSDVALNFDLASLITGTGDTYTYTVASSDATNVPAASPRTVASAANITDLYSNTTSAAVIITYTITPIGSNGCTGNTFTLAATIHPNPVILPITNFELCDDTTDGDDTNGSVNFNLLLKNSEILGAQTGINITYHTDSNAALLGQNAITTITTTNRTIYVRLTNSTTGCFSTTSFNLVVNPLPIVDSSVELKQCDTDSDAVTDFNLTQANLRISPDPSFTYTYHNSLAGALNNTDFVTNDIVHTAANGDKVWARITNIFGCSRTSEVSLVVSATTIPPTYTYPLAACDDYLNASDPDDDGIDYFDLTVIEPVLTTQFPVGQSYTYSYYFNEADAISEQNAISNTTNFRNTVPFNQSIWVRIESNLYDCAGLGPYLRLTVNPLPDFDLGQDLILCVDPVTGQGSQILNAIPTTAGTYSYQWTPANPSGNSGLFTITTAGTYSVIVTNTATGCQSSDSISFTTSSGPATIIAVLTTEAFSSGLATIEAVVTGGFGIYEYSIDGVDWQSSPVFSGLENGSYTIYVRDIQGCDLLPSEPIQTITYPNYFTPNGDGYNDTWMIRLPVNYEALISIYDRYGKLIKQISSFGTGWDGTYSGNPMPSTDYWFKVEYTENNIRKEFKSHFSLKR
jgi:gliding motility-associated-like protein